LILRRNLVGFGLTREPVSGQHPSHLFDLVRLCLVAAGLEIQDLDDPIASKDVVVAANPFAKSQVVQQSAQVAETDIRVRIPAKNLIQCLRDLAHSAARFTAFA
jgi:hypothetical protein